MRRAASLLALMWPWACVDQLGAPMVCADAAATIAGDVLDLMSNSNHCGCVGNVCPAAINAFGACTGGRCNLLCLEGWGDCDGDASNGCERWLRTLDHCGACGRSCSVPRGTATCAMGTCEVARCEATFANCDGDASNGCEANLRSLAHCGACGSRCARSNAQTSCASGACEVTTCNDGFDNCDGDSENGCEVDLRSSLFHCNQCNASCSSNGGTASCTNRSCQIQCASGLANCDMDSRSNGCETVLATSFFHCGACGNNCGSTSFRNATATVCSRGVCTFEACQSGYDNCNRTASDGCEVDLRTSLDHCGACNRACRPPNATGTCASGSCRITCTAGFADCNGSPADGCERMGACP